MGQLGRRIEQRIEVLGLNQTELAERLSDEARAKGGKRVSPPMVSSWITGLHLPERPNVQLLASVLSVPYDELWGLRSTDAEEKDALTREVRRVSDALASLQAALVRNGVIPDAM